METLAEMGNYFYFGKMGNLIFGVSHNEILASFSRLVCTEYAV